MAEDTPPARHARIDADELTRVDISADGTRLCLVLRDTAGRPASVSLPLASLNTMLTAVPRGDPRNAAPGQVHTLESWSLGEDARGLLLTLHLPNGASIALSVKPWQIAAIASLAGQGAPPRRDRLN